MSSDSHCSEGDPVSLWRRDTIRTRLSVLEREEEAALLSGEEGHGHTRDALDMRSPLILLEEGGVCLL